MDTHNDDLVQDMMQQLSFGTDSLSSSSKQHETPSKSTNKHKSQHHREKRFIWITKEKRIVLPPGTQLVFTPTLGKTHILFITMQFNRCQVQVPVNFVIKYFYPFFCLSDAINAISTTWD